ncbi:MAG: leucine-rich repeat protein, partial [Lachnospiraceae bacterium]|nr:leucine-rich repeat protein [Lachnospiraceae bacterium]
KIPNQVTQIDGYAFDNCTKLSSVTLSKSLSNFGAGVFKNCECLTEITIPKSLTTAKSGVNHSDGVFTGTSLKSVYFEDGVTEIPEWLFAGCTSLEEIEIPDTVTVIESGAFYKAEGLKRVKLSSNLKSIEGNSTYTYNGAFNGCKSLAGIELPDSLEKIGGGAFANCLSLESLLIPEYVSVINNETFMNCSSLKGIVLPENLLSVGEKAFYECESLAEINLPKKVSKVGKYCCAENKAMVKVRISSEVPVTVGYYAFQNCTSLKNVVFSNYVTSIGSYCFDGDTELTEVNLGMGITEIPQNAFSNCNTLESIIIPYYVTSIGKNAFANDPKLSSITVLPTVTSIDSTAFSYSDSRLTMYGVKGSYAETFCTNNPGKAVFAEKSVNATKVEFDADSISIPSGSSIVPPLTIEPADCTDNITWVSADESIVKVTNGLAKGVKAGTTKLTVTVADPVTGVGKKASINVTVTQGVTGITLNKTKLELDGGEVYKLVATVKPTNADDKRIAWESSDQDIATVDEEGNVTAIGKGSCTITVTALDGSEKTATCTVTVKTNLIVVSSAADLQSEHPYPINASDIWMYKDERMNGMVVTFSEETMLETDSTDCIVIMDASRKQIGKYSADQLSGKSVEVPGNTVYIQLLSDGFQSGDYGFAVTDIRAKGTASPTPTPTKTVTPTPTPTGGANPTPTPTGGAKPTPTGGANPTPTPTPGPDGPDPYVDAPTIQLAAKAKYNVAELMAPQIPEGKQIAKYKVDSKKIASVSKKGILTAKKAGTVIVTAFEKTGKKSYEPIAYATVTVVKPEFKFTNKDLTYTGATVDANDFISNLPQGATISWSVPPKKTAIATVDSSSGVITAGVKNGTVKVSCEISEGGYSVKYSADIKVKIPKPAATLNIKDGKTKKLTLKNVSKYTEVEWSSPSQAIIIQSTSKNYIVKLTALSTLDPEAAAAPIPITAVVDGKEYVTYVTIKQ